MKLNLINRLGDLNPQLFREIKGRLKPFAIAVATITSLLGQFCIYLYQLREFPGEKYPLSREYCNLALSGRKRLDDLSAALNKLQVQKNFYNSKQHFDAEKLASVKQQITEVSQQQSELNKAYYSNYCPLDQINYADWWQDHWGYIFQSLSVIFIFTLIVAGTYLIINNLALEERKGTLNFIRLSPQSENTVLTGKILGVPILVYLFTALAIPLHLISGRSAGIAWSHILSYYVVLAGSCWFFFSAALVYGLFTRFLGGFQPWLGSGVVLWFLTLSTMMASSGPYINHATAWIRIFSPVDMTGYLFPNLFNRYQWENFQSLQFFHLPVGGSLLGLLVVHMLNYGFWSYWLWRGLERRFRNPNASMFSKTQSYALVGATQVFLWGFTLQNHKNVYFKGDQRIYDIAQQVTENLLWIFMVNILLMLSMCIILTPIRQTVIDWARFRHYEKTNRQGWNNNLIGDLIFGEKSPAVVAIAIHLAMICMPIAVWLIILPGFATKHSYSAYSFINDIGRFRGLLGIVLQCTIALILATIGQKLLMMKTSKRYFWAVGIVSALIFAPPFIYGILNISAYEEGTAWLITALPWIGLGGTNNAAVIFAIVAEAIVLTLLNVTLSKQISKLGESETQQLLKAG